MGEVRVLHIRHQRPCQRMVRTGSSLCGLLVAVGALVAPSIALQQRRNRQREQQEHIYEDHRDYFTQ